nr:immunoglobulin heavy chain junction region [Macaca mulatta]
CSRGVGGHGYFDFW